jgi:hypothetical protein
VKSGKNYKLLQQQGAGHDEIRLALGKAIRTDGTPFHAVHRTRRRVH